MCFREVHEECELNVSIDIRVHNNRSERSKNNAVNAVPSGNSVFDIAEV